MIESFFRSLERERVAYLLISGQATVLYGAAYFSEDIDLWIEPTASNADALLAALRSAGATYYKLTPPLEPPYMLRGHGFHFHVPGPSEFYLDIMGQPPRVPAFAEARGAATVMSTSWGDLPTIGIRHLVALKTTQRPADYPIISQLVLRYMEGVADPSSEDYRWAIRNLHTIDELEVLLRTWPAAVDACEPPPLGAFAEEVAAAEQVPESVRLDTDRWLGERIFTLRQADRAYWRDIIDELRQLRRDGRLVPLGAPAIPER